MFCFRSIVFIYGYDQEEKLQFVTEILLPQLPLNIISEAKIFKIEGHTYLLDSSYFLIMGFKFYSEANTLNIISNYLICIR